MPDAIWGPSDVPEALMRRIEAGDTELALRLLNRDTRDAALSEFDLGMSYDQLQALSAQLDELASMSFQDALTTLRQNGFTLL